MKGRPGVKALEGDWVMQAFSEFGSEFGIWVKRGSISHLDKEERWLCMSIYQVLACVILSAQRSDEKSQLTRISRVRT